jgi:phage gp16-like protein
MARPSPSSTRSKSMAAIHTGAKALGWDVETYRDFLVQMTGKASAKDLTVDEIAIVLDAMRARGYKRPDGSTAPVARVTSDNPAAAQIAKIDELWASLAKTGALNDPSETALRSFGRRVTGIAAPAFMTVEQRSKVIEALKAWLRRESPSATRPSAAPRPVE